MAYSVEKSNPSEPNNGTAGPSLHKNQQQSKTKIMLLLPISAVTETTKTDRQTTTILVVSMLSPICGVKDGSGERPNDCFQKVLLLK